MKKKVSFISNILSMESLEPLSTHLAQEPPSYSIKSFFDICTWPSFYFHSVHPTQDLMGLLGISIIDPIVSIHSSRIFLSANSILILFSNIKTQSLLISFCIKSTFLSMAFKGFCTSPLQSFLKLTPYCSSAHLGTLFLPFRVFFSPFSSLYLVHHHAPEPPLSLEQPLLLHLGTQSFLSSFRDITLLQRTKRIKHFLEMCTLVHNFPSFLGLFLYVFWKWCEQTSFFGGADRAIKPTLMPWLV